jgi:Outer membrane receptor proteins, mostly Fe transport
LNDKAGRNSFDIASAKQIQVVKGASSTSYGSGALGGAVIVTSLSADDLLRNKDLYADAQVTYSELSDKGRVGSRLALRHGDTSALLDVSYWEGEETRNYQQDLYNRTLDGGSASLRLDHYVSDRWKLSARAKLYREEHRDKKAQHRFNLTVSGISKPLIKPNKSKPRNFGLAVNITPSSLG